MEDRTGRGVPGDKLSPSKIELRRMAQQAEVRTSEDDWTGIKDAAERRKLQNRLNQRIYRRRRGAKPKVPSQPRNSKVDAALQALVQSEQSQEQPEKETTTLSSPSAGLQLITSVSTTVPSSNFQLIDSNRYTTSSPSSATSAPIISETLSTTSSNTQLTLSSSNINAINDSHVPHPNRYRMHNLSPSQLRELMSQYEANIRQAYLQGSPRADQLLTLIQFNVFRALISNTITIGLSFSWMEDENAISPLSSPNPNINPSTPSSLLPTELQRSIDHHPWIDVFPFPAMRNNMLLAEDQYDEMALCNDLVEFCNVPNEKTGLIVWKDPWDQSGWEVSETFAERWAWVIKGCKELFASTNYWRERRGEDPLVWEV
ncbi:uncharacterized protein PAC_12606 [Phialocephala subalpina]|uniref:BZIP domain-containing protein n=1 Tax=Phialocephala subalpina TaxID=576137 RepID=A0A1L7XCF0_9HELO|nr:uncharacterized protein PAC_12606 [Phialocephala subalpina]